MFSRSERQNVYDTAIAQLRADRVERSQPQAQLDSAFTDITARPFFQESIEILCDAMTHERHARLNEVERPR